VKAVEVELALGAQRVEQAKATAAAQAARCAQVKEMFEAVTR